MTTASNPIISVDLNLNLENHKENIIIDIEYNCNAFRGNEQYDQMVK